MCYVCLRCSLTVLWGALLDCTDEALSFTDGAPAAAVSSPSPAARTAFPTSLAGLVPAPTGGKVFSPIRYRR